MHSPDAAQIMVTLRNRDGSVQSRETQRLASMQLTFWEPEACRRLRAGCPRVVPGDGVVLPGDTLPFDLLHESPALVYGSQISPQSKTSTGETAASKGAQMGP